MKNESLIHLKFDYEEAIQSKKDILYAEKSLMITTTKMKEYLSSRVEELEKRLKLHRKAKELIICIKKIQKNIPDVNFSDILNKKDERDDETAKVKTKRDGDYDNVESQLRDIQKKLDSLQ